MNRLLRIGARYACILASLSHTIKPRQFLIPTNHSSTTKLMKMIQQKGTSLQDPFLNVLRKEKVPVSIFLVNGIKLLGHIESFDPFVVLLRNNVNQMIYKHAISTIVPARPVRIPRDGGVSGHDAPGNDYEHDPEPHQDGPSGNQ